MYGAGTAPARLLPSGMSTMGARLLDTWNRWSRIPGGRWLFSRLIGRVAPYSGSIRPTVMDLAPGRARVTIRERRALRNPFASVHAVALANLGELTSGLAMWTLMPARLRGIVTSLRITFTKKGRGRLVAESVVVLPDVTAPMAHEVTALIRDEAGDAVAEVTVTWQLDLRP